MGISGTIRFKPRHSFHRKVCQEVAHLLNIDWQFHCPYHTQSSGQVKHTNRVLKERLSKMHQKGMAWPDASPTVLCSIWATHNKTTGLCPFEVITGRSMSLPGTLDLRKADVNFMSDTMLNYCRQLFNAVSRFKQTDK